MSYFWKDPKRPLLGANIHLLKYVGLLLPENKLYLLLSYSMAISITVTTISEYIDLCLNRSDINLVFSNIIYSTLATVLVAKILSLIINQNNWKDVINYVTRVDNEERSSKDPLVKKVIDDYTKYCSRMTYSFWGLTVVTTLIVIFYPLTKICMSSMNRISRNGTEDYIKIMRIWVPFDMSTPWVYYIVILYEIKVCIYGSICMAAIDSAVIATMVFIRGQLTLLRLRCSQIFGEDNELITDEECMARIKNCHRIRVELMKYVKLFDSMLSPIMLLYMIVCSVMLCASAYQLTNDSDPMQRLFTAEYLVFGIAQLFIYCWHSNDVYYKSQEVMLGPYESKWWSQGVVGRKYVLLLIGQMQNTVVFTAGRFAHLTIPTFISILKGAYSYYTLLQNH